MQLPWISSASSDSLIRQPHQSASSDIFLDAYLKWIRLLCQMADTWCLILWFEMKLTHKWPFTMVSGHFFSICMFMFPKTEVQTVNLNLFKLHMPYSNAWSLSSLEVPDFDHIEKKSYHLTTGPFGVVVSSLNSHQADPSIPIRKLFTFLPYSIH